MNFRPPPVAATPINGAPTWNPLHHLSQSSDKRWAELSEPEFPNYTPPEDDERTKYQAKQYNRHVDKLHSIHKDNIYSP